MQKIIIVEDEPLIAFDLAQIVGTKTGADVVVVPSTGEARHHLAKTSFVFLDMNVVDGTTFDLARTLTAMRIPFAFTSGSQRSDLPGDLLSAPFIVKPCRDIDIYRALSNCLGTRRIVRNTPDY